MNVMPKLTEGQFHTVWTEAVGRKGYDKPLFQELLVDMKAKGDIGPVTKTILPEKMRDFILDETLGNLSFESYKSGYNDAIKVLETCQRMIGGFDEAISRLNKYKEHHHANWNLTREHFKRLFTKNDNKNVSRWNDEQD